MDVLKKFYMQVSYIFSSFIVFMCVLFGFVYFLR